MSIIYEKIPFNILLLLNKKIYNNDISIKIIYYIIKDYFPYLSKYLLNNKNLYKYLISIYNPQKLNTLLNDEYITQYKIYKNNLNYNITNFLKNNISNIKNELNSSKSKKIYNMEYILVRIEICCKIIAKYNCNINYIINNIFSLLNI